MGSVTTFSDKNTQDRNLSEKSFSLRLLSPNNNKSPTAFFSAKIPIIESMD